MLASLEQICRMTDDGAADRNMQPMSSETISRHVDVHHRISHCGADEAGHGMNLDDIDSRMGKTALERTEPTTEMQPLNLLLESFQMLERKACTQLPAAWRVCFLE